MCTAKWLFFRRIATLLSICVSDILPYSIDSYWTQPDAYFLLLPSNVAFSYSFSIKGEKQGLQWMFTLRVLGKLDFWWKISFLRSGQLSIKSCFNTDFNRLYSVEFNFFVTVINICPLSMLSRKNGKNPEWNLATLPPQKEMWKFYEKLHCFWIYARIKLGFVSKAVKPHTEYILYSLGVA